MSAAELIEQSKRQKQILHSNTRLSVGLQSTSTRATMSSVPESLAALGGGAANGPSDSPRVNGFVSWARGLVLRSFVFFHLNALLFSLLVVMALLLRRPRLLERILTRFLRGEPSVARLFDWMELTSMYLQAHSSRCVYHRERGNEKMFNCWGLRYFTALG